MVFLNLPTPTLFRFAGLGLVPVSGGLSGAGCGQAAVGNNDGNYGDEDDDDVVVDDDDDDDDDDDNDDDDDDDDDAVVVVVVLFVHFFDTAIRPGKQTNVNLL